MVASSVPSGDRAREGGAGGAGLTKRKARSDLIGAVLDRLAGKAAEVIESGAAEKFIEIMEENQRLKGQVAALESLLRDRTVKTEAVRLPDAEREKTDSALADK